jgi:hypothetical protein
MFLVVALIVYRSEFAMSLIIFKVTLLNLSSIQTDLADKSVSLSLIKLPRNHSFLVWNDNYCLGKINFVVIFYSNSCRLHVRLIFIIEQFIDLTFRISVKLHLLLGW